ncbi:MAG: hypothetical protein A2020_14485 [Lentisphaerae bacterium GWF2_45_14]|nr:MAG: hypothetical protein A2020_14485 [Lentisphaerae bacterium GWF2_45_14]
MENFGLFGGQCLRKSAAPGWRSPSIFSGIGLMQSMAIRKMRYNREKYQTKYIHKTSIKIG